jgi:hypothetical protein
MITSVVLATVISTIFICLLSIINTGEFVETVTTVLPNVAAFIAVFLLAASILVGLPLTFVLAYLFRDKELFYGVLFSVPALVGAVLGVMSNGLSPEAVISFVIGLVAGAVWIWRFKALVEPHLAGFPLFNKTN